MVAAVFRGHVERSSVTPPGVEETQGVSMAESLNAQTYSNPPSQISQQFGTGRQVPLTERRYLELLGFLWDEAAILDRRDNRSWIDKCIAPDISYVMPVCVTRRRDSPESYETDAFHFLENYESLKRRIQRAEGTQAWAADPPPRARRFVTSVSVWETAKQGEYDVSSSLLVVRTQDDDFKPDVLTAVRYDLIRIPGEGTPRLARRKIVADQTTIGMSNLAIFL
jgi:3-phenylpropionate/cinnamic acid dioxygenase small subunit